MKKIIRCLSLMLAIFSSLSAAHTVWNIYLYMEPGSSLHQAAFKNLNDIAKHKPDNVNIYALLHYEGSTAMLYGIEKNIFLQLKKVPFGEYGSDIFINVVKELEEKNPAEHHCIILWNHGYGILVPHYNSQTQEWELAEDDPNAESCILRSARAQEHKYCHKGMMTNMETLTCMDNEELIKLFDCLCNEVFHKKIDICGLDMCKGAMFEHGYQLRDYVDILIGSQECELKDGWPYDLILSELQKDPTMSPNNFAVAIIESYKKYYDQHAPQGIFTQSAFDLQYCEELKNHLDLIANHLIELLHEPMFREIFKTVRNQCRAFCDAAMYLDCYTFLEYIALALESFEKNSHMESLQKTCGDACSTIKKMVLANAVGSNIQADVHGISLYHPCRKIDQTYLNVPFAQESSWLNYLTAFCGTIN